MAIEEARESEPALGIKEARGSTARYTIEDARRWQAKYNHRSSILKIAKEEGVDPGTVSSWLKKLGVEIKQGCHFVEQPPTQFSSELNALIQGGPKSIQDFLEAKVWGIQFSPQDLQQADRFCKFVRMHQDGRGVKEISESLNLHRGTVAEWRKGTDLPYLVKACDSILGRSIRQGWRLAPLLVSSGGNELGDWIELPNAIKDYDDLTFVLKQILPTEEAYYRAEKFGIPKSTLNKMRVELLG
jgi:hypothetical protein